MVALIMTMDEYVVYVFTDSDGFPLVAHHVMSIEVDEAKHFLDPKAVLCGPTSAPGLANFDEGHLDFSIGSAGNECFAPFSGGKVGLIGVEDVFKYSAGWEEFRVDMIERFDGRVELCDLVGGE